MTRLNWLLLGLGVLLMLLSTREWHLERDDALPPELAGEPDLYMEDAVIDEFDRDGVLRYRLEARRVSHYPQQGMALVEAPRFELAHGDAPWHARAATARVDYVETGDGTSDETITLESGVVLERDTADGRFVRLEAEHLVLVADGRRARADHGVKIVTEAGQTVAERMEGELASGRLRLFSNGGGRVITTVEARAG
jgi:LPS export ABC transporter protein LptC